MLEVREATAQDVREQTLEFVQYPGESVNV